MIGFTRDFLKLAKLWRNKGPQFAAGVALLSLRARLMRQADRSWERKLGVSFNVHHVFLNSLNIDSPNKQHGFSYVPCTEVAVRTLLGSIDADFRKFCFVDFGSGEGRSMILASKYSFDEAIGVEFAEELHTAAVRNIRQAYPEAASKNKIRSVHLDAAQFEIPRRDSVLYFYNPFGEVVFQRILTNIERTYRECGPKFYVIFHQTRASLETNDTRNPELLRAAPFLKEIPVRFPNWWSRFLLGSQDLYLFETIDRMDERDSAPASACQLVEVT